MILFEWSAYLDGGTKVFYTDKGTFYMDNRLRTQTRGEIFSYYPCDDGEFLNQEDKERFLKELGEAVESENFGERLLGDDSSKLFLYIGHHSKWADRIENLEEWKRKYKERK